MAFQQDCEHCQQPGDKTRDFLVAVAPTGKVAWWARKDCPLHGIKEITDECSTKQETSS